MSNREILPIYNLQASAHGTLFLPVKNYIIEISLNNGIYVVNKEFDMTVAISPQNNMTAIDHPMGKVFHYQNKIEMRVNHPQGYRYAKMWKKGISFTTEQRMVTFLMDAGGVKTTVDWFMVMEEDVASKAFYYNCDFGENRVNQAIDMIYQSQFWVDSMGVQNWKVGNVRISQNLDGDIKIFKNSDVVITCNPHNKSIFVRSLHMHCTASMNFDGHLFLRNNDRRIHYDGNLFNIRNAGQSAVIDGQNELKLS